MPLQCILRRQRLITASANEAWLPSSWSSDASFSDFSLNMQIPSGKLKGAILVLSKNHCLETCSVIVAGFHGRKLGSPRFCKDPWQVVLKHFQGQSKNLWTQNTRNNTSANVLSTRAQWFRPSEQKTPKIKTGHTYSYVKLNFRVGLFSCIFLFEAIFCCFFGILYLPYFTREKWPK